MAREAARVRKSTAITQDIDEDAVAPLFVQPVDRACEDVVVIHVSAPQSGASQVPVAALRRLLTCGPITPKSAKCQCERFAELRSEEHTSELQSLMRISYAVFCLKKKKYINQNTKQSQYSSHSKQ